MAPYLVGRVACELGSKAMHGSIARVVLMTAKLPEPLRAIGHTMKAVTYIHQNASIAAPCDRAVAAYGIRVLYTCTNMCTHVNA